MSRTQADTRGRLAVIGLGVNGLSAAYAAARLGYRVHGYDRAPIGDDSASSLGIGKIIRYGYLDDFFARLMTETDERWQEVERATGTRLWERVGTVQWGTVAGEGLAAVERSLAAAGREHRVVEPDVPPSPR